jgi:putative tryptophan/tyrosine transport system substrate-binding protein
MRRREFITLLGGAAAAWPLGARAQKPKVPVVGLLSGSSSEALSSLLLAFHQGLRQTGFVEGRNLAIEYRWADNQYDRLPGLAADLVRSQVSVISTIGSQQAALAAKGATTTIPVVFSIGADPVQNGLVVSVNRPGGNITGITQLAGTVVSKRMQVLHDLLPSAKVYGVLRDPETNRGLIIKDVEAAVAAFGGRMELVDARNDGDFGAAIAGLVQKRVDALNVLPGTLFGAHLDDLVTLAAQHALPTIYPTREFAKAGGLMSYGSDVADAYRQTGIYVGRILRGEKPADLPVLQPTKFDLVINLKTAKALSLTVPPSLLAIADEVIE